MIRSMDLYLLIVLQLRVGHEIIVSLFKRCGMAEVLSSKLSQLLLGNRFSMYYFY